MILGAHLVLAPLESILHQMTTDGTINVDPAGTPAFMDVSGRWYPLVPAIEGLVHHFEIFASRNKLLLDLSLLAVLIDSLKQNLPITDSTIFALQHLLDHLRTLLSFSSASQHVDILNTLECRYEFERLAA